MAYNGVIWSKMFIFLTVSMTIARPKRQVDGLLTQSLVRWLRARCTCFTCLVHKVLYGLPLQFSAVDLDCRDQDWCAMWGAPHIHMLFCHSNKFFDSKIFCKQMLEYQSLNINHFFLTVEQIDLSSLTPYVAMLSYCGSISQITFPS